MKQKTSDSRQLAVRLLFFIGDYVENSYAHYENFIDLLKEITLYASFQIHFHNAFALQKVLRAQALTSYLRKDI